MRSLTPQATTTAQPRTNPTTFSGGGLQVPPAGPVPTNPPVFNSDMYNSNLDFASFPGATWDMGFDAQQMSFAGCDLNSGNFVSNRFDFCDFSFANLTNSSFGGVFEFAYNTFAYADLSGSVLNGHGGYLDHTDFTGARLVNCSFIDITFIGVNFIGADLTGATFSGCTWERGVISLDDDTVFWDSTTKFPAGFDTSVFPASAHVPPNYAGMTLTGVDLSNLLLAHANFKGATLTDCLLPGNCCYADFSGAQILGTTMYDSYCAAAWANFSGATVDVGPGAPSRPNNRGFDLPLLAHSNWQDAQIAWSGQLSWDSGSSVFFGRGDGNFTYCNFNGIKNPPGSCLVFSDVNVSYSTFVGARLYDLDTVPDMSAGSDHVTDPGVGETTMCYCDFTDCQGGWFEECTLIGSTFKGASLPATTFTFANLCDVDLSEATVGNNAFDAGPLGNFHRADPFQGAVNGVLQGNAAVDDSGANNPTIYRPSGGATGALLVAVLMSGDSSLTWTPPTGWTSVALQNTGGLGSIEIFTKTYETGEPGFYTFTGSAGASACGGFIAQCLGTAPSLDGYSINLTGGSGTSDTANSLTPSQDSDAWVTVFFNTSGYNYWGTTGGGPADFARLTYSAASSPYAGAIAGFVKYLSDASPTGTAVATTTSPANWMSVSFLVAGGAAPLFDSLATYNSNTKFPPGIDLSLMLPAETNPLVAGSGPGVTHGQNGSPPLADFTGQTLDATMGIGSSGQIQVYDSNLKDVTFTPGTYYNMEGMFNANLRGATFDGGTFPYGFYECNFGNPMTGGTGLQRSLVDATPQPPQARVSRVTRSLVPVATPTPIARRAGA